MGRGGYDTTDATSPSSCVASTVISAHHAARAKSESEAAEAAAKVASAKVAKKKKEGGVKVARNTEKAAMETAARRYVAIAPKPVPKEVESEGDSDATVKP